MTTGSVRVAILALFCILCSAYASAIELSIDHRFIGAVEGMPHWLERMRWGTVQDSLYQSVTGAEVLGDAEIGSVLFYGEADLQATISEEPAGQIRELYGSVAYGPIAFRGGVFRQTLGYTGPMNLSSGSMSVSGNAAPIPRLQLLTPDFVSVPFTGDILAFSGGLSHGWFTGDRAVDLPLLHEKWLYLQLQRERVFRARLGLIHHAQWGGDGVGTVPATFSNYWRVFFASSGGSDSSESDQINSVGNSLGTWDANFTLFLDNWEITLYRHYFFEDSAGFREFNNVTDGLSGIHINFTQVQFIQNIVLETLWTRHQGGEYHDLGFLGRPDIIWGGRDHYYDHSAYRSGWTYQNHILGTSLFETTGEDESLRIASNRVIAWHAGIDGAISPRIGYRVLSTVTQHYPAYARATLVTEAERTKRQWYHYLGVTLRRPARIDGAELSVGLAFDHGELFDERYGAEIFFRYRLR